MLHLFTPAPECHKTPGGRISAIYDDMAKQTHLLIAGRTGSGKSVVVNGIIHSQLCQHASGTTQLILIDPKRVELAQWRHVPHCLYYASEPAERVQALRMALEEIESRYKIMQRTGQRRYNGSKIYVVIDDSKKRGSAPSAADRANRTGRVGHAHSVHVMPYRASAVNATSVQL